MKELSIQIQPLRDGQFSSEKLVDKLQVLDLNPSHSKHNDDGDYENIIMQTADITTLWRTVKNLFKNEPDYSDWVKNVSIITCHGDNGWVDYLLLHHFDLNQKLDEIV